MTEVLHIHVSVIYSDTKNIEDNNDTVLRGCCETARIAANEVEARIMQKIPFNKVCSLVIGEKQKPE